MGDFLVTYGQGGYLGRFRSAERLGRDDRVVLRTVRGVELGTVLGEPLSKAEGDADGDILRRATLADDLELSRLGARARTILAESQALADSTGLPLLFLDGEILLDGTQAILQAVHWADCDATSLFEELSSRHGLAVKLADVTAAPAKVGGCSTCGAEKSGCSSCGTGGGCSTGSCSKGSVKSAQELTDYFAGLRRQMDAAEARVSLH